MAIMWRYQIRVDDTPMMHCAAVEIPANAEQAAEVLSALGNYAEGMRQTYLEINPDKDVTTFWEAWER